MEERIFRDFQTTVSGYYYSYIASYRQFTYLLKSQLQIIKFMHGQLI